MKEWNGLKFEAKSVPENWRGEFEAAERARREAIREYEVMFSAKMAAAGIKPPETSPPPPVPSREQVLSLFETMLTVPEVVEDIKRVSEWEDKNPEGPLDKMPTGYGQTKSHFMTWWIRKYTNSYRKFTGETSLKFYLILTLPIVKYLKTGDLEQCYAEIESGLEKHNL